MLSKEAVRQFKKEWKKEYGEEISDEFALEEAFNLLTIMDKIFRPIKAKWLDEIKSSEKPTT